MLVKGYKLASAQTKVTSVDALSMSGDIRDFCTVLETEYLGPHQLPPKVRNRRSWGRPAHAGASRGRCPRRAIPSERAANRGRGRPRREWVGKALWRRTCNLPALCGVAASSAFLRPWIISVSVLGCGRLEKADHSTNARAIVFFLSFSKFVFSFPWATSVRWEGEQWY